jgi:hypothetical protein
LADDDEDVGLMGSSPRARAEQAKDRHDTAVIALNRDASTHIGGRTPVIDTAGRLGLTAAQLDQRL